MFERISLDWNEMSTLLRAIFQGCALAEPSGPWRLTFAPGRLENLTFFIQIICWAPEILQVQSLGSLQFSLEHSLVFFATSYWNMALFEHFGCIFCIMSVSLILWHLSGTVFAISKFSTQFYLFRFDFVFCGLT